MVAFVSVVTVIGCFGSSEPAAPEADEQPFRGVTLTVAVPLGSGFAESWQSLLVEWSARTGAEVKVVETATADLAGDAPAALQIVPIAELSDLVSAGRVAGMPREVQSEASLNWNDISPGVATALGSVERNPAVLPLAAPVLVLYYRSDILKKAGLAPPESWDDYQKLLDTLDRWAPGMAAAEPWGEEFRATMFLARAAAAARPPGQYSFAFDVETGAPLIDSPPFVKALEQSAAAVARMPAEALSWTPSDCRQQILTGKAALAIALETSESATPTGNAAADSARAEGMQIGFAPLPGTRSVYNRGTGKWEPTSGGVHRISTTGFGGLCGTVSPKATPEQASAAWNLLATLAEPGNLMVAFPGWARSPCRASQLVEAGRWTGPELTAAESAAYLDVLSGILRDTKLTAELPVPGSEMFRKLLAEKLAPALKDSNSAAETLKSLQAEWSTIKDSIGPEKVRDTYRRRHGLTAVRGG